MRRHFEPGPDSAQCGFVQAFHCVFGAFFPGAGGINSVYGSGILSLAITGLRIFGPFCILGLGRKMMRGKATISTKLEDGTEKKAHSRQKEGVGLPWPGTICHGTSCSSPSTQWYQNFMQDPTAHQNVLFPSFWGETSFESDTIF